MAHKSFLFFSALVNSIINGANLMQTAKNGLVYLHPSNSWVSEQISGHVDVVYRHKWGAYYRYYNYYGGSPYKGFKTEIYH